MARIDERDEQRPARQARRRQRRRERAEQERREVEEVALAYESAAESEVERRHLDGEDDDRRSTVSHANARRLAALDADEVRDGPRAADEKRQQAARERDDREVRGRRLEDLHAAAGCRSRSASTCRAARGRVDDERERADRAERVDGDERDVLAERRPQSPSDERVSDDHGGQHDARARRTACARAPRRAIAATASRSLRDRRPRDRRLDRRAAPRRTPDTPTTSVSRNDDSVIQGTVTVATATTKGRHAIRGQPASEQVRRDRRRAHDERVQDVRLVEAVRGSRRDETPARSRSG